MIELLSIDISNYCSKQCPFCYNHSSLEGISMWSPLEVIDFASDCIAHGIKAVSLGGGEPFEYEGIYDVIDALYPKCYLSVTSNGLPLENPQTLKMLAEHKPDKIHLTIHHPNDDTEIMRIERQLQSIAQLGIKPGINLLVGADLIDHAKDVYERLNKKLTSSQIILIPQRYSNTPTPKQLASVAGGKPFQSPSCLLKCQRPSEVCSVTWDKKVNSCSFSPDKVPLETLDFNGLVKALDCVRWRSCQLET